MERLREKNTEINLAGTNLTETNLIEANLAETNLAEANLIEANLIEKNLTEANLIETNITETNTESGAAMMHSGSIDHTNDKEEGGMQETWRETWQAFWKEESGIGVIEVVLILVVLIGLVAIFKNRINQLLSTIFEKITSMSEQVY